LPLCETIVEGIPLELRTKQDTEDRTKTGHGKGICVTDDARIAIGCLNSTEQSKLGGTEFSRASSVTRAS
jgi:hypothetical protein